MLFQAFGKQNINRYILEVREIKCLVTLRNQEVVAHAFRTTSNTE